MSNAKKSSAITTTIPALKAQVTAIARAFGSVESAQTKLGDAVLAAAPKVKADQIGTFCAMVKDALTVKNPDKAGSIKTQVSYIRRVLTAVIVDKVKVEPGQSLRGLYDSLPKAKTGGAAHGANLPNPAKDEKPAATIVTLTKEEARELDVNAAITKLFGTCNPELKFAVEYAVSHSGMFMSWAAGSARAEQLKALEALAAQKPAAKKPAVQKPAAKRKAA